MCINVVAEKVVSMTVEDRELLMVKLGDKWHIYLFDWIEGLFDYDETDYEPITRLV